jgi:hypothetical protein
MKGHPEIMNLVIAGLWIVPFISKKSAGEASRPGESFTQPRPAPHIIWLPGG